MATMSTSIPSSSPPLSDFDLDLTPKQQRIISQATPFRFHPSQTNPKHVEPYFPLFTPDSCSKPSTARIDFPLILTPARSTDFTAQTECLNDEKVALQLIGPPYPYSNDMAREWAEINWKRTEDVFEGWARQIDEARLKSDEEVTADEGNSLSSSLRLEKPKMGLPFNSIRRGDTGQWIGEIGVCRWEYREIEDETRRREAARENEAKEVGEDGLVWSFGYYLIPEYQGLSIMSTCLTSLIENYFIPYLSATTIRASAFVDNLASVRTQEKTGYLVRTGETFWHEVVESRGGGRREECMLEWKKP